MKPKLFPYLLLLPLVLVVIAYGEDRPTRKAFKGVELYSWRGKEGAWLFALLPGTNRLKPESEVKQKENQILGVPELEQRFLKLAEGEQIFWFHRDPKAFEYPGEDITRDVTSAAKKAKVELHLPQKRE